MCVLLNPLLIVDVCVSQDLCEMSADDQSDEEVVPIFRPFTRESLAAIEARIAEETARAAQKGEEGEGEAEHRPPAHYDSDDGLEPDPNLEVGMPVPKMMLAHLTPEVIATPLEEIDKFYENKRVSTTFYPSMS